MTPRLALLVGRSMSLSGWLTTTSSGIPQNFCEITKGRLPIIATRNTDPQLLRDILRINAIHKDLCLGKAKPSAKN